MNVVTILVSKIITFILFELTKAHFWVALTVWNATLIHSFSLRKQYFTFLIDFAELS